MKTALVTGVTQGIGRITAKTLAAQGMRVLLVARSAERGNELLTEIKNETKNDTHELFLADLASMAAVQKLAREVAAKHESFDVLVNNAGAINQTRELTGDGYEKTFATNHLAYFLLTELLRPRVKERIVSVASDAHRRAKGIQFEDLTFEKNYAAMRVYCHSKLANVMWNYELARRLQADGSKVTANALHPGVVRTGFGKNDPGWFKVVIKIASPFFISPEKGAQTTIYLASSPEVAAASGKYYAKSREHGSTRVSHDEAAQKQLWDLSVEMTKKWSSL